VPVAEAHTEEVTVTVLAEAPMKQAAIDKVAPQGAGEPAGEALSEASPSESAPAAGGGGEIGHSEGGSPHEMRRRVSSFI
jgi:hypothetical protein